MMAFIALKYEYRLNFEKSFRQQLKDKNSNQFVQDSKTFSVESFSFCDAQNSIMQTKSIDFIEISQHG